MGAELVGYLVKGPAAIELTGETETLCITQLAALAELQRLPCDPEHPQVVAWFTKHSMLRGGVNDHDRRDFMDEFFDVRDGYVYDEKSLRAFVQWWNEDCTDRDVACRLDPENERQRIVFAGEMTWGDRPEGVGYLWIDWAVFSGVGEILGVH